MPPVSDGSTVLDALEGLAFEIEHVQLRVTALEHRMTTHEADPGPQLIARRNGDSAVRDGETWRRFDARADRLIARLQELG